MDHGCSVTPRPCSCCLSSDAFLPYVERGDIILIGATTENPSFEVVSALLSRAEVYALNALSTTSLVGLLTRAAKVLNLTADAEALEQIARYSSGDARMAYNVLELAASVAPDGVLDKATLESVLEGRTFVYDKSGDGHFNLISALHKSIRSSDVDAALYWLARMLESGEDRQYLARRLVRMAVEDIGLADPRALEQAMAAQQAAHFLGAPEGDQALAQGAFPICTDQSGGIGRFLLAGPALRLSSARSVQIGNAPLAQVAIYLAIAPKSDAGYQALNQARALVSQSPAEPVPMQLRNASTRSMKEWGYGEGYQHAHEFEDGINTMQCLPDALKGAEFYHPTARGTEQRIAERLAAIRQRKSQE